MNDDTDEEEEEERESGESEGEGPFDDSTTTTTAAPKTEEELNSMTVKELKDLCKAADLRTTGLKDALIARYLEHQAEQLKERESEKQQQSSSTIPTTRPLSGSTQRSLVDAQPARRPPGFSVPPSASNRALPLSKPGAYYARPPSPSIETVIEKARQYTSQPRYTTSSRPPYYSDGGSGTQDPNPSNPTLVKYIKKNPFDTIPGYSGLPQNPTNTGYDRSDRPDRYDPSDNPRLHSQSGVVAMSKAAATMMESENEQLARDAQFVIGEVKAYIYDMGSEAVRVYCHTLIHIYRQLLYFYNKRILCILLLIL